MTLIRVSLACLAILLGLARPAGMSAADALNWRASQGAVDADIVSMDLETVLGKISLATGWQVFLEPNTSRTVSTRFKDRPIDKALDLLLGDLNRVLLPPRANQPARLLVFRTTEKEATLLIKPKVAKEKKPKPIPNELIVTLKPGQNIDELAKLLNAKVVGRMDDLNTYRLQFEDEKATELAREYLGMHEGVATVDNNYPVFRVLPMQAFGGGAPLDLFPKAVPDGDRIVIGLIDTMVDAEKSGIKDFLLPGISVVGDVQHIEGAPMHGDAMSQAILQAVSMLQNGTDGTPVRILPVDVYGTSDMANTFDVANGIAQAIRAGANPINLSLSSEGDTLILRQVIEHGLQQGVLFVAAAGNEPVATLNYPAAYPEVLAVTSGDPSGNIADFANYGEFVDVVAPGSTTIQYGGQTYRVGGTSVSTSLTSGMAAALRQNTRASWTEIQQKILATMAVKPGATSP